MVISLNLFCVSALSCRMKCSDGKILHLVFGFILSLSLLALLFQNEMLLFGFFIESGKFCFKEWKKVFSVYVNFKCGCISRFLYILTDVQTNATNNTGFRSIINVNIFWQENRTRFHCLIKYILSWGGGRKVVRLFWRCRHPGWPCLHNFAAILKWASMGCSVWWSVIVTDSTYFSSSTKIVPVCYLSWF